MTSSATTSDRQASIDGDTLMAAGDGQGKQERGNVTTILGKARRTILTTFFMLVVVSFNFEHLFQYHRSTMTVLSALHGRDANETHTTLSITTVNKTYNNNGNLTNATILQRLSQQNPLVTATIVSCNRMDLLLQTLEKFFQNAWVPHLFATPPVVVLMDCYNVTLEQRVRSVYSSQLVGLANTTVQKDLAPPKLRGSAAALWNQRLALQHWVHTPYWLAMEDDWEFVEPHFVPLALDLFTRYSTTTSPFWGVVGRGADTFRPFTNRSAPRMVASMRPEEERATASNTTTISHVAWTLNQRSGAAGRFGCYTANPTLYVTQQALNMTHNIFNFTFEGDFSLHLCRTFGVQSRIAVFETAFYEHRGGSNSILGHNRR